MERIRGEPRGDPDRHKTRKETAKRDSRLGAYVSYVVLLASGSPFMSLRRREAQGASNFGGFCKNPRSSPASPHVPFPGTMS